jgi:hypothetical protein
LLRYWGGNHRIKRRGVAGGREGVKVGGLMCRLRWRKRKRRSNVDVDVDVNVKVSVDTGMQEGVV